MNPTTTTTAKGKVEYNINAPISSLPFSQGNIVGPVCTEPRGTECHAVQSSFMLHKNDNIYTCDGTCSNHATCFLGTCLCHPGYGGKSCDEKLEIANPWYTADCPNLLDSNTLDIDRRSLGGIESCHEGLSESASLGTGLSYCAYLCYSSVDYGSAIVPHALWQKAQEAESNVWKSTQGEDGDRVNEHFQGFADYRCIPGNLGDVIEFGAGPWTQFRGLLHRRPDVTVESYTILEPGAETYIKDVDGCAYTTGRLAMYPNASMFHDFPVFINSNQGESALGSQRQFDTVMTVNVIEHVQNAIEFLHALHQSLKPGGLLIFHDRYYNTPVDGDCALGRNVFHPIRLTKHVFDHFLADFDIIFNNCEGETTIDGWGARGCTERGYYVIARKKLVR